ncbi:hypothetical protein NLG97_g9245 [Lecanicillium saksenae]|uniref:Uncharacterized protein n=1 Tax=Lecanicillium saksenae TaxID=468837 RepID=A0ACC1QJ99_9HYPO|nr:hypothetical protein NLG97_g9245 [Lecanicillium saksenae]
MHEGRGVSRISWDLNSQYGERVDDGAPAWEDPGAGSGNKISLVDLTKKKAARPLENDGLWHDGINTLDASSKYGGDQARASDGAMAPGWHGRRETCVVNAAILKSKFPHTGGKEFYKPIVVDLDLPVVMDDDYAEPATAHTQS